MKLEKSPTISVVMSVYNDEKYVGGAIQSILDQTYTDFEFIIINDGSTDASLEKIRAFKDPRIILISRKNKGLVYSLNEGIKKARGKFIARQDADDISMPRKLELLVEAFKDNGAVLSSTAFSMFKGNQDTIIDRQYAPSNNLLLKRELFTQNPFCHGATMFRRQSCIKVGGYRDVGPVEDYDLWMRLADTGTFAYVSSEQYLWRINENGISQQQAMTQARDATKLRANYIDNHKIPTMSNADFAAFIAELRSSNTLQKQYTVRRLVIDQIGISKILEKQGETRLARLELRRLFRLGLRGYQVYLRYVIRERLLHG